MRRRSRFHTNVPMDWQTHFGFFVIIPGIAMLSTWLISLASWLKRMDASSLYTAALVSGIAASLLLFIARLPLYRAGQFMTFGSAALPRPHRWLRRIAFWVFAAAVALFTIVGTKV